MARLRSSDPTWSLELDRDMIDVTSENPSPNEDWKYTDRNGHEHRYDHGYPTLDLIIDEQHWCDGHEGIYNHDPHMAVDESHYECLICREVIKPSMRPGGWPRSILGMLTATLTGVRSDGAELVVSLIEAEVDSIRVAADRNAVVQTILDSAVDRVVSITFSR